MKTCDSSFLVSQIAPIVGLYFPHSFNRIGKYVSKYLLGIQCVVICVALQLYFIGSASGFYFAYDFCVYDAMSSEVAYLLRFLPLLLAILTCTTILVCRCVSTPVTALNLAQFLYLLSLST